MWIPIITGVLQGILFYGLNWKFRREVDRYLEAIQALRAEADVKGANLLKAMQAINDASLLAQRAENERLIAIIRQETGFKKPEKVQPS